MRTPIEYLRGIARRERRTPATGGYINAETARKVAAQLNTGCTRPIPVATPPKPPTGKVTLHIGGQQIPPASIEIEQTLELRSEAPAVQPPASYENTLRLTMQAAAEERAERLRNTCPCYVIYSHCHYPLQHSA
jgi:hypothetical protein